MSRYTNGRGMVDGRLRVALLLVALGIVLQSVGCSRYVEDKWSRARPATHRASGTVEYLGQPMSRAVVTFVARDEARGKEFTAVGFTDDGGRFELKTFRPGDGAIEGSHRVTIEKRSLGGGEALSEKTPTSREEYDAQKAAQAGPPKLVSELPARFGDAKKSGLTAEVTKKGPNRFVFRLDDSGPETK